MGRFASLDDLIRKKNLNQVGKGMFNDVSDITLTKSISLEVVDYDDKKLKKLTKILSKNNIDINTFKEIVDGDHINVIKSKYCPHCVKEAKLIENIKNDIHFVPMTKDELTNKYSNEWEKYTDDDKKKMNIFSKEDFINRLFKEINDKNVSSKDWGNIAKKLNDDEKEKYRDIIIEKNEIAKVRMYDLYADDNHEANVARTLAEFFDISGVPSYTLNCNFNDILSKNNTKNCTTSGELSEKQLKAIINKK